MKTLTTLLTVGILFCAGCNGTGEQIVSKGDTEAIFNGSDLSGWKSSGGSRWVVEDGCIVGTQGKDFAAGDLFTEQEYDDFELNITYRVKYPCNSGIWFRYQSEKKTYQADILEYKDPECYAGSLYCPGKLFIAMNTDKTIVDREGWNVMRIRAQGDHLKIWMNGHQVADVHDDTSDRGRIGFQVHPGDNFGPMKIVVREAVIEQL